MENESFPLSEELIVLCKNREALQEDEEMAYDAFCALNSANDLKSFEWCLNNLHEFETDVAREFAINNIYHFIYSTWYQIPESLYPLLIEELFTKIWEDPNYQDKKKEIMIYKTQNLAIYGLYPKFWPDFFNFLLNLPKPHLYGFLSFFNDTFYISASISIRDVESLKNDCLQDGSQAKILQVVVNDVLDGVEGAASSLISTIQWVSLSLLLDSDLISLFQQLLAQNDTCVIGLQIFIKILKRPIAQDVLFEFVTELQIDDSIQQIASEFEDDKEIIYLCSELLFSSFGKLISSQIPSIFDLISNVAEISMNLFMFPSAKSTTLNYRLLMEIFGYYSMLIPDYIPMIISKITSSIALYSEDADLITQTSLNLLLVAANNSGIDIVPHLVSLADGLNPAENIEEYATLLASLNKVLADSDDEESSLTHSLYELFLPLISIEPPFSPSHFIAMWNYLEIINPIIQDEDFDPEVRADIFMKCVELVMCKECEQTIPNDRNKLLENIYNMCLQNFQAISAILDVKPILPDFVQSRELYLIKSASLIASAFEPDERFQFYTETLLYFADYLKLSIASETSGTEKSKLADIFSPQKMKIIDVLDFFILAKTDDLEQLNPTLMDFFKSIYNEKNDMMIQVFSYFCKATVKTLGIDAFEIFWDMAQNITDFETATIIVETSLPLAENSPFNENIGLIYSYIEKVFENQNHSKRLRRTLDEVVQMKLFYEASANFFMMILPNLNEDENEEIIATSISRLIGLMSSKNLSNEMINKVVLFFLSNPPCFAEKTEEIFSVFMISLNEFQRTRGEELKELLLNFFKLLKELSSIVTDPNWESPDWELITEIGENGPKAMEQILSCPGDDFESMVNDFLDDVAPQKNYYEDEYAADTEDAIDDNDD